VTLTDPLLPRHPWVAALLLGTIATPAAVIIAWLAPRPFDAIVALPLVLLDIWFGRNPSIGSTEDEGMLVRLLTLLLGIGLTWLLYVIVARLLIWRLAATDEG
jgi:hypothetical protein